MNEVQKLKFYQKGTLTVGNRLVDEASATCRRAGTVRIPSPPAIAPAGLRRGARRALCDRRGDARRGPRPRRGQRDRLPRGVHDALPRDVVADRLDAFAVRQRGGGGDRRRGGDAGARPQRNAVVAQGGDGGTTDIGFGCLSGMFERNDDVLYICYDNEGYMNTGVQRSVRDPADRRTATTRRSAPGPGNVFGTGKYTAEDRRCARNSLRRHRERRRPARSRGQGDEGDGHPRRALHPDQRALPPRLGRGLHDTIKLARLAIETGLFPIFEAEHGLCHAVCARSAARPRSSNI